MDFLGTSGFLHQNLCALLSKHQAEHASCDSTRIHETETSNAADILALSFSLQSAYLYKEEYVSLFKNYYLSWQENEEQLISNGKHFQEDENNV